MDDILPLNEPQIIGEEHGSLNELTQDAAMLREQIAELEMALKEQKERLEKVSKVILRTLELMEIDSIKSHGCLFFKEMRSSVTTPKTPEDKELLFKFLQEKGIFLEIASVNSMTLNSLYKSLADDAAKEGVLDFKLPGVAEPVSYTNLKIRRA